MVLELSIDVGEKIENIKFLVIIWGEAI